MIPTEKRNIIHGVYTQNLSFVFSLLLFEFTTFVTSEFQLKN